MTTTPDPLAPRGWTAVTGGSGAIGAAIVTRLLSAGHRVLSLDTTESDAPGAPDEHWFRSAVVDVCDPSAVGTILAEVDQDGSLDALVTAAGTQRTGPSTSTSIDDWELQIRVNLTGTWVPMQAALQLFEARGTGRVVTISSEIGLAGAAEYAAYAASKGGVIALTKALAREFAPRGILVNSVAPGPIAAGMFLRTHHEDSALIEQQMPAGRLGTPADVASSVEFLLSGAADYYIGQVLSPNGGAVI